MNPLLKRHLTGYVRQKFFFWLLAGYLLVVGVLTGFSSLLTLDSTGPFLGGSSFSMQNLYISGRVLYWFSSSLLLATTLMLVPISALGAISGEYENRTLDLLRTTTLRARDVILGKTGASLIVGTLYVLSPFPVLVAGFWLGGVTITELFITMLLLLSTMMVCIAIAMFVTTRARKTGGAVFTYYGWLMFSSVILTMAAAAVGTLVGFWYARPFIESPPAWLEAVFRYGWVILCGFHPVPAAIATEALGIQQGEWFLLHFTFSTSSISSITVALPSPWIVYVLYTSLLTWILLRLAVRRMEKPER